MLKHNYAYTNGVRLHYVEQGSGPLVVLCHGWPESWYSWRNQIETLANAGYRVVAPDQRGYGHSDTPLAVEAYGIFDLVGDLVGLVHSLGEEKAILIGHDWGSMVAAPTALLRPDIFDAVGLLSVPYIPRRSVRPAMRFETMSQKRHFYQAYFQSVGHVEKELEEDLRKTILGVLYTASGDWSGNGFAVFEKNTRLVDNLAIPEKLPAWLTEQDISQYVEQFGASGFRGPINWYRNMDRNWAATAFLSGAKLSQPTIFIAGEKDGVLKIAAEEYEALERNVPNLTKKVLIPGAGHWIQQERSSEVNELLISFVRELR
ncbi:alpha/beta hydrolase [soil metagenome]